jgi:hypothetical protein
VLTVIRRAAIVRAMEQQTGERIAGVGDIEIVATTIALAFADDPVWSPAMGGPRTSIADRRPLWRIFIAGVVRYPWSRLVSGGAAVSVWIPPDGTEMSPEQEAELDCRPSAAPRTGGGC